MYQDCGSHTHTLVPRRAREHRVLLCNSSYLPVRPVANRRTADFMDIIAVPLDDPGSASLIHREELAGPETNIRTGCHDVGVILGKVDKAACASVDTINVWDINDVRDPDLPFTITEPGSARPAPTGGGTPPRSPGTER